jgi:hypothetical protein
MAALLVAGGAARAQSTAPSHEAAEPPPSRASDQTATVPTADGTSQKPNRAAERADPKAPNWMTTLIIIFAAQAAGHGPGAAFPK